MLGSEKHCEYRIYDEEKHTDLKKDDVIQLTCIENKEVKTFKIRYVKCITLQGLSQNLIFKNIIKDDIEKEILSNITFETILDVFGGYGDNTVIVCIGLGDELIKLDKELKNI